MNLKDSEEAEDHFMDFEEEFFRRRALTFENSFSLDNEDELTLDTTSSYSSNSFCAGDKINILMEQYREQSKQLECTPNDNSKKGSKFRHRLQSFGHRSSKSDSTKYQAAAFRGLSPNLNREWKSFENCSDRNQNHIYHRRGSSSKSSNHARKRGNTIELGGFERVRESYRKKSVESFRSMAQMQQLAKTNEDRRLDVNNDYLDSHYQRNNHISPYHDNNQNNNRLHYQQTMDISEQYFLRMNQLCLKEGKERQNFEPIEQDYNKAADDIPAFEGLGVGIHPEGYNLEDGILVEKDDSQTLKLDDDDSASNTGKRPNQEDLVADFIASDVLQRLDE